MTTITKEINLLDIEDVEEALSAYIGKKKFYYRCGIQISLQ